MSSPDEGSLRTSSATSWSSFCLFVWNPYTGLVLGRSGKSWGKLALFYLIYYGILAAVFAIFMVAMLSTLSPEKPVYRMGDQPLLATPGMAIVPNIDYGREIPLINFDPSDSSSYAQHIQELQDFLTRYNTSSSRDVYSGCDVNEPPSNCTFGTDMLGVCGGETDPDFGYSSGQPCVLLKINKVYGWSPTLHTINPESTLLAGRWTTSDIAISCEQKDDKNRDIHGAIGAVDYYPSGGFPANCYPFCGPQPDQPSYLQPVVMVKFPNVTRGSPVRVWCRAWAQNMEVHMRDEAASAVFILDVEA